MARFKPPRTVGCERDANGVQIVRINHASIIRFNITRPGSYRIVHQRRGSTPAALCSCGHPFGFWSIFNACYICEVCGRPVSAPANRRTITHFIFDPHIPPYVAYDEESSNFDPFMAALGAQRSAVPTAAVVEDGPESIRVVGDTRTQSGNTYYWTGSTFASLQNYILSGHMISSIVPLSARILARQRAERLGLVVPDEGQTASTRRPRAPATVEHVEPVTWRGVIGTPRTDPSR